MSEKDNTKNEQNAKTTIKIEISETDAREVLNGFAYPCPTELPNEIHLIIKPEK